MDVKTPKREDAGDLDMIIDQGARTLAQAKRARVKVGGVYVMSEKPSAARVKQAVAASRDMLERLGDKITRPGVQLKAVRNIPLFFVDPEHPGRFLRKLNGKIEGGVLEDGAFKVVD